MNKSIFNFFTAVTLCLLWQTELAQANDFEPVQTPLTKLSSTHGLVFEGHTLLSLAADSRWVFSDGHPMDTASVAPNAGISERPFCRVFAHSVPSFQTGGRHFAFLPEAPYVRASAMNRISLSFVVQQQGNVSGRMIVDCEKRGAESLTLEELRQVFGHHASFALKKRKNPQNPDRQSFAKKVLHALAPKYFVTQHGGYLGYVTLGLGWKAGEFYEANLQAGYVPAFAGGQEIWQVSMKHEFHPIPTIRIPLGRKDEKTLDLDLLHIGLSAIYSPDKDLWLKLPAQYPSGHHPLPTALRLAPYVGTSLTFGRHEIYAEYTALDLQLKHYYRNRNELKTKDLKRLGTYGIGYKYIFE